MITMKNRIKYLSEECKVLERLLNERDRIIDKLELDNKKLRQVCDDYNDLMRGCIFDEIR